LIDAMWNRGLDQHRIDVLNKVVTLLGDPDPLVAACCSESVQAAGKMH